MRPRIHLLNPMWDESGGSEHRVAALAGALSPDADVTIWSDHEPAPGWRARLPIRKIAPRRLAFPIRGTLVVVGVYFRVGDWLRWSRPSRTILVCNTFSPRGLARQRQRVSWGGSRPLELVFASETLRRKLDLPGIVQPSVVDLEEFSPRLESRTTFTVGRLSRDVAEKHHERDPGLYRRLAARGCQVRVMGGTVLEPALREAGGLEGIALLPAQAQPASAFLAGLDCFFYRTSRSFFEASGRVVTEAMAMGLPVVADRVGGYADVIEPGVNGFLFDDDDEAVAQIERLRLDPELRRRIGRAARESVERELSPGARREIVEFYTR